VSRVVGTMRAPVPLTRHATPTLVRTALCLALGLAPSASGAPSQGLALAVHPDRLMLVGKAQGTFEVTNPTGRQLVVDASTADFRLRPNGRVVVSPRLPPSRSARRWLTVSPRTLRLAPHRTVTLRVASNPAAGASPGDHNALVQFTTRPVGSRLVRTRTQIGLPVRVRVNGPLLRRLQIVSLRVTRSRSKRTLQLVVRNRGNINERLLPRAVTVRLRRGGRTVRTLVAPARPILPGGRTVYTLPLARALSGSVTAVVTVRPARAAVAGPRAPQLRPFSRPFRLSLGGTR
jgi:hypothetical protein